MAEPTADQVTVDLLSGGLIGAAQNLQARWGERVVVEMTPMVPTDRDPRSRGWNARPDRMVFAYQGGTEAGLTAAVAAVSSDGGPGDYEVHRHGAVWHVVPTSRHEAEGQVVAYSALTDAVIDLTAINGTLDAWQTWAVAVEELRVATGVRLGDAVADPWLPKSLGLASGGPVEPISLRRPRAPAVEVLDEIVASVGPEWRWAVPSYCDGERAWITLLPYRVEPADEARLNVAPIPPK